MQPLNRQSAFVPLILHPAVMFGSTSAALLASSVFAGAALVFRARRRRAELPAKPHGLDRAGGENRLLRKCETVLSQRTDQIMIVVERSVDTHNYSAIIRTAEALGIQHIWVISPPGLNPEGNAVKRRRKKDVWVEDRKAQAVHVAFAKKATKWVSIREFDDTESCIAALREDGRTIWVTDLSQEAVDFDDLLGRESPSPGGIPDKVAVVFGSEGMGVSETMINAADTRVYLKMHGFADSLNLSVSAALIMQRLKFAAPGSVGRMAEEDRQKLRLMWYPMMGRTDEQREEFRKQAIHENTGVNRQIMPYVSAPKNQPNFFESIFHPNLIP